ncbi:cobalt-precorrin-6A reductase [Tomitella cavernea]|uniref:Cobalt-precorrin-6A reductase n=1 Tax=Tomitella cavernea TaxID=1387982 RepID=A0ABP9CYB6_9ACTN|nr:cobalt-precorrin-6A reductase [Tomitella cavernea]
MSVLVLGGTGEARALAERLDGAGVPFVSSLAGRVGRPRLPVGPVRIGGFGGADGLASYLCGERITAVVDATHPFAAGISAHAADACAQARVPLLRLQRPGWSDEPGAHRWKWVDGHDAAARAAAGRGGTVFVTTGRQTLDRFVGPLASCPTLVRVVEQLDIAVPGEWMVLESRGPYDLAAERALMREHGIRVLVTKDSGGAMTRAKLDAADELKVDVIIVRRPPAPAGVETVADVRAAAEWATGVTGAG